MAEELLFARAMVQLVGNARVAAARPGMHTVRQRKTDRTWAKPSPEGDWINVCRGRYDSIAVAECEHHACRSQPSGTFIVA